MISPTKDPAPLKPRSLGHHASLLLALTLGASSCLAASITLILPSQLSLPAVSVASFSQTVTSPEHSLELFNRNEKNGWTLTAEVADEQLAGDFSSASIPASITFKSITWIGGGQGSAAGIFIHPDGSRIEADPGFGLGKYAIVFEIQYHAPAFPIADSYRGDSIFIVQ